LTLGGGADRRRRCVPALEPGRGDVRSARREAVGFDATGGDERVEIPTVEAHVAPELGEADAAFGDESSDETRLGTEQVGGLLDSE
jgi:hypothetical protein